MMAREERGSTIFFYAQNCDEPDLINLRLLSHSSNGKSRFIFHRPGVAQPYDWVMTEPEPHRNPRKRSKWNDESAEAESAGETSTARSPFKRRRTPTDTAVDVEVTVVEKTSPRMISLSGSAYVPKRTAHPSLQSSRSVYSYERLNQIEEGSYGVVFRAREKTTGEIVALKKLKLDEEKYGFPITALREINALMNCKHENVVNIREVVVGETLTQ